MLQLKCIIVICSLKQICCCVLLRINHPKEGEGRKLIVCLFYRWGWRAQEDGEEEEVRQDPNTNEFRKKRHQIRESPVIFFIVKLTY